MFTNERNFYFYFLFLRFSYVSIKYRLINFIFLIKIKLKIVEWNDAVLSHIKYNVYKQNTNTVYTFIFKI